MPEQQPGLALVKAKEFEPYSGPFENLARCIDPDQLKIDPSERPTYEFQVIQWLRLPAGADEKQSQPGASVILEVPAYESGLPVHMFKALPPPQGQWLMEVSVGGDGRLMGGRYSSADSGSPPL